MFGKFQGLKNVGVGELCVGEGASRVVVSHGLVGLHDLSVCLE